MARPSSTSSPAGPLELDRFLTHRHRSRRRSRRRPSQGHRPPRHQARQHFCHQARQREDSRLRPRQSRGLCQPSSKSDATTTRVSDPRPHQPRHHAGHRRLHVSRTSPRQRSRRPQRPLLLRRRPLRNGHRHVAVPRRHLRPDFRIHPQSRSGLSGPPQSRSSRETGRHHQSALEKDRDLRYQHASEMRAELKRLKRDTDSGRSAVLPAADPPLTAQPTHAAPVSSTASQQRDSGSATPRSGSPIPPDQSSAAGQTFASAAAVAPSAAGRTRWRGALAALIAIAIIVVAAIYWRSHASAKLTEKDTIVLADFVNTTGDSVFDGALRQGLSSQLEQSPFLNLLSDERIAQTLSLMAQPKDARLTTISPATSASAPPAPPRSRAPSPAWARNTSSV